jgi:glutamine synthetase type III
LARFFCEVTQEPSEQQDDLQVFRTLPNGKTTEFKDTLLNETNRNTFYEWSGLLERRSMKARMDQVEAAYQKIIEQLEQ